MSSIFDYINYNNKEVDTTIDVVNTSCNLLLNDCLVMLKDIKEGSIHTIVSDPPYAVNIDVWDKKLPSIEVWNECYRILKPGGHLVFFGQPSMTPIICSLLGQTKFEYRDMYIWAYQGTHTKGFKTDDGKFRSKIRNVYNPIFVYRKELDYKTEQLNWENNHTNLLNVKATKQAYKGSHASILKKYNATGEKHLQSKDNDNTFNKLKKKGWIPDIDGAEPTNIQYVPRATLKEKTINGRIKNPHKTVKPVALIVWLVKLFTSAPENIVLDMYMGSGTTGMACKYVNRSFIGIDNLKKNVDLARFRVDNTFELDEKFFNNIKPI